MFPVVVVVVFVVIITTVILVLERVKGEHVVDLCHQGTG